MDSSLVGLIDQVLSENLTQTSMAGYLELPMPLSNSGQKPGGRKHLPYKLAILLLYGRVPGVTRLDSGRMLVELKKFSNYFRSSTQYVKATAQTLKDWGILETLDMQSHTMLVQFARPASFKEDIDAHNS